MTDFAPLPVVLYDGDCSFCRLWVGYWKEQTGARVEYAPWQTSLDRFPSVTADACRKSVQWIGPDGAQASGAEAVFRILALLRGYGWLLWLYEKTALFAGPAELGYSLVAANRGIGYFLTRLLWGSSVQRSTYEKSVSWFRRALAAIYVFAFASFAVQARGLIGEKGILPMGLYLDAVRAQLGASAIWRVPTLFWWGHSDLVLLYVSWGGVALGFLALVARARSRWYPALFALLFVYYLSVVSAGQTFMQYQWDTLLLETGFIAIFLSPARGRVWLVQWLLFRLMFESGFAKLASHDSTWHTFTALTFHYETQPLPTALAWFAHHLPVAFHRLSAGVMFVIELAVPFLIFGPRRTKQLAAWLILTLQLLIALTGNYTFFNLLAMALCILLFDDAALPGRAVALSRGRRWATATAVTFILMLSTPPLVRMLGYELPGEEEMLGPFQPFGIVNSYGLFASMTTSRPEISIEASLDGERWEPYVFRYKPGDLKRAPGWVAPHQPRLDWQMWFASLGTLRQNPWFARLALALLEGSQPVQDLFGTVPFNGTKPRFIRANVDTYHFTTADERTRTGAWWKREPAGPYLPAVSLRSR